MKRKLLALAIAGAFVAPAAMAEGNVTIYGDMNASVDLTKSGAVGGAGVSANKLSSNESNIGLKGSKDLGSGYTAVWQVESAVALDGTVATGAGVAPAMVGSVLAGRDTFVGLAGGFGTVLGGRHDTPYKMATRDLDMFKDTIADNRSLTSVHDLRVTNALAYVSPKIADSTTIVGAYVFGAENPTPGSVKGSAFSLAAMYEAGAIKGAAAYQTITVGTGTTGSLGQGTLGLPLAAVNAKLSAFKVGGGYTADKFGINAAIERATTALAGLPSVNQTNLYLGAKYNVTSNDAIKAAYGKLGSTATAGAPSNGAHQISIGYDHAMAKDVTVYALYTKLSNDLGGAAGLGQTVDGEITGAVNGGANSAPSAISIGMAYKF